MGFATAVVLFAFAILIPFIYLQAVSEGEPAALDPRALAFVGIFEVFLIGSGIGELLKARKAKRRPAEPLAPTQTAPPPLTAPAMPPSPPPIKVSFTLTDLEEEVLDYIIKHGGRISIEQASKDLGLSEDRLKKTINSLKEKGKIEF